MKKTLLLLIALAFLTAHAFAQNEVLDKGDAAFQNGKYLDAAELYKKAYVDLDKKNKEPHPRGYSTEVKKTKATIPFKIGECYRMMNNLKEEVQWYGKAARAHCADSAAAANYLNAAQAKMDSIPAVENPLSNYKPYMDKVPTTTDSIHKK